MQKNKKSFASKIFQKLVLRKKKNIYEKVLKEGE